MKCPACGKWNRDTLPVCFNCGKALEGTEAKEPSWKDEMDKAVPSKTYIRVDNEGNQSSTTDKRDDLAQEMRDLQSRKEKGIQEQRKLREMGARQGFVPNSRTIRQVDGRQDPVNQERQNRFAETDSTNDRQAVEYDDTVWSMPAGNSYRSTNGFSDGRHRVNTSGRMMKIIGVILLILVLIGGAVYAIFTIPFCSSRKQQSENPEDHEKVTVIDALFGEDEEKEQVRITASILDDMAAHTIEIPAPEGTSVWIGELHQHFPSIGGYATAEVPDYQWYEDENGVDVETVEVVLHPYLKTKTGEQKKMDEIRYTVEVPLSPLTLISPASIREKTVVSDDRYNLRFKVDKNATVTINDVDYTSFVNSLQDGEVNLNVNIQATGDNVFEIVTRCRYYRENRVKVIISRDPVTIEVHLDTTMSDRWSSKTMTVRGTTLAGADVVILSPYQNLDLSEMASVGSFSFDAVFETIGDNNIVIRVSMDGVEPTTYTRKVYYLPPASEYTKLAWSMNKSYDYSDYLNMTELRIAKTQVYICTGTITEIISENPQLAIMELSNTADSAGLNPRKVMLENKSTDTWIVGQEYSVYADAYGTYNSYPRLTGRYTYPPRK